MRKELEHFYIGRSYGGNQEWFRSFMMRLGGCGAETACDSSLYFALHAGIDNIYPFDKDNLTKKDYVNFAHIMEKYLWPRMSGIFKQSIFIEGYAKYLEDCGVDRIRMREFSGREPYEKAADVLMRQIDAGYPVPTLILNHRDRAFKDYVWHWFLINGYDRPEGVRTEGGAPEGTELKDAELKDAKTGRSVIDVLRAAGAKGTGSKIADANGMRVKAVTYSGYEWLDFRRLWETGHEPKGGFVLYEVE